MTSVCLSYAMMIKMFVTIKEINGLLLLDLTKITLISLKCQLVDNYDLNHCLGLTPVPCKTLTYSCS